jgi:uncharacterized protein (DUF885 family)
MKPLMAVVIASLAVAACGAPPEAPSIDVFFDTFTADWVRMSPNQAISARYFSGAEQDTLETQMTPMTREWRQRRVDMARRGLAQLATYDRDLLNDTDRVSADLMKWQLEMLVEGDKYEDYFFPFEQFAGANVNLPNALTIVHPINTEKDAANYVARLGQVAARMDEAIADASARAQKGMVPPRFILEATIAQMEQFISTPPARNPFVAVFNDRMAAVSAIPAAARERMRAEAERITARQVYPAWQRALALLRPLQAGATDVAGLSRFPGGTEAYAYLLRAYTSTNLTADEIHQIGLREVARLEREMDTIFRKLGRQQGSIPARVEQLEKDLAYPITEAGRTTIMADANAIVRDAQERSKALFARTPRAPVEARAFPRFREANAAANYTVPARDGSRPGVVQVPLRPSYMTKFGLATLMYHEAVPGHHFQLALELENDANPRFRQIRAFGGISAVTEGWALYAERLAAESGWYEGNPEGLLGQLDGALFRARRLVVDTGIHTKGWTRQQAIDYGIEASEIERYVVNPGQACAYMIGQLKLVELRDKARTALGAKFDAKAFHDAVLGMGTAPLTMIEAQVDRYINAARGVSS